MKIFILLLFSLNFTPYYHHCSAHTASYDQPLYQRSPGVLGAQMQPEKSTTDNLQRFFPPLDNKDIVRSAENLCCKIKGSFVDLLKEHEDALEIIMPFLTFRNDCRENYKHDLVVADYTISFIKHLERIEVFKLDDLLKKIRDPHAKERYIVGIKVLSFTNCSVVFAKEFWKSIFLLQTIHIEALKELSATYPGYSVHHVNHKEQEILNLFRSVVDPRHQYISKLADWI